MILLKERFKEEWPYFAAHPLRWVSRWWAFNRPCARRERLKKLMEFSSVCGVTRLPNETDSQLRARIKIGTHGFGVRLARASEVIIKAEGESVATATKK